MVDAAAAGRPATYYDGALAFVQTLSGRHVDDADGPLGQRPRTRRWAGTSTKVFGGDSRGYGSSRMNLTSLAGQTVRVVFRVTGDENFSGVRLVGRRHPRLHVPQRGGLRAGHDSVAAATASAKVAWSARAYVGGSPVASYRITRSGGKVNTAAASARADHADRAQGRTPA